jgi:phosphoribosylformimino-5-aminoimidazole carboxamide ribotide isomerase
VLSGFDVGNFKEPRMLLREFQRVGADQVILLDLARVGSGEGVDFPFLKSVLTELNLKVFVGGGVRDIKDLVELRNMGVFGVLLATALHSGRVRVEELRRVGLSLS